MILPAPCSKKSICHSHLHMTHLVLVAPFTPCSAQPSDAERIFGFLPPRPHSSPLTLPPCQVPGPPGGWLWIYWARCVAGGRGGSGHVRLSVCVGALRSSAVTSERRGCVIAWRLLVCCWGQPKPCLLIHRLLPSSNSLHSLVCCWGQPKPC